jgi:GNAT superfamily N-acetyltransferase
MGGILIRSAVGKDVEAMVELLRQLFEIEQDFSFEPGRHERGLEMLLDDDRAALLVAELGDKVVGMASGQLVVSTAEGGWSLLVEDVVVVESYQHRGIGRELLAVLEVWGRANDATRLQLLADRGNDRGLAFYQNIGWDLTSLVCLRKNRRSQGADPERSE